MSSDKADKATLLFNSLDLNNNGTLSVFEATDFATSNRINFAKFKAKLGLESSKEVSRKTFVDKYVAGKLPELDSIVERMAATGAMSSSKEGADSVTIASRSNLDGTWMNTASENMEAFLVGLGVGFLKRKLAASTSYGIQKYVQIIKVEGDSVLIESKGLNSGHCSNTLKVGSQKIETMHDGQATALVSWDAGDLIVAMTMQGKEVVITRYVEAGSLIMETEITESGIRAKRTFTNKHVK